jgi:hypothetical protein
MIKEMHTDFARLRFLSHDIVRFGAGEIPSRKML